MDESNKDDQMNNTQLLAGAITILTFLFLGLTTSFNSTFEPFILIESLNLYSFKNLDYLSVVFFFCMLGLAFMCFMFFSIDKKLHNAITVSASLGIFSCGVVVASLSITLPDINFPEYINAEHHAVKTFEKGLAQNDLSLIKESLKHGKSISDDKRLLLQLLANECTYQCSDLNKLFKSEH